MEARRRSQSEEPYYNQVHRLCGPSDHNQYTPRQTRGGSRGTSGCGTRCSDRYASRRTFFFLLPGPSSALPVKGAASPATHYGSPRAGPRGPYSATSWFMVVASTASRVYACRVDASGGSPLCTSAAAHLHRPTTSPQSRSSVGPDQRWTEWSPQTRWPPVWAAFGVQKQALRPNSSVLQCASFQLQRVGNRRARIRGAHWCVQGISCSALGPLPARSTTCKAPAPRASPGSVDRPLLARPCRRRSEEPGSRAAR